MLEGYAFLYGRRYSISTTSDISSDEFEEVEVEVKKPLSHILSVRMDDDDFKRLRLAAKMQGVGLTTMARIMLKQTLSRPDHQLVSQALEQRGMGEELGELVDDASVPPGDSDPSLLVLPMDRLTNLASMIENAIQALLSDAVHRASQVSPQDALYKPLADRVRAGSGG